METVLVEKSSFFFFFFFTNHVQMNVALMGASDILNEYISPACAVKQQQQLTYKSGFYFLS